MSSPRVKVGFSSEALRDVSLERCHVRRGALINLLSGGRGLIHDCKLDKKRIHRSKLEGTKWCWGLKKVKKGYAKG